MHIKSALLIFILLGSSLPALASEAELQAALATKDELLNQFNECRANLERCIVENVTGPKLVKTLELARINQANRPNVGQLEAEMGKRLAKQQEVYQRLSAIHRELEKTQRAGQEARALMEKESVACKKGDAESCIREDNIRANVIPVREKRQQEAGLDWQKVTVELEKINAQIRYEKIVLTEAQEAEAELDAARERITDYVLLGYRLDGKYSRPGACDDLQNQCTDLYQQYLAAQEQYLNLLNASKEPDEDVAENTDGDDAGEEEQPLPDQEPESPPIQFEFDETEEFEYEQVPEEPNGQADARCNSLLAEFNGAPTLDAQRGILQQATDCSWFGQALAALMIEELEQNPPDLESDPSPQQQVQPGALNVVPNPYPNPYAKPPKPWKPHVIHGVSDFDFFNRPPPKKPQEEAIKQPPKEPAKPQNHPTGGHAYGY